MSGRNPVGRGKGDASSLRSVQREQAERRSALKPRKGDPLFRDVWRKFALKVHPDLFGQFPDLQTRNTESLQKLQGLLNEVKSGDRSSEERMKGRTEQLEFFVRGSAPPTGSSATATFMRLPLTIRIPDGGNCPDVLAEALGNMFATVGLPQRFHWGSEYWQIAYTLPPEDKERWDE